MVTEQANRVKKSISARTILLVLLTIVVTVFAVQNWGPVDVWPIGHQKPLALVIGIAFVLGGLIGWLAHSLLSGSGGRLAPDNASERVIR